MKAKRITEWECGSCGDRYTEKEDAEECCGGEVDTEDVTEDDECDESENEIDDEDEDD